MKSGTVAPSVHEIVYVEQSEFRLYSEVIQVVQTRDRLWVRPLCLCEYESVPILESLTPQQVYDLRGGSDLVWPGAVFQNALDFEWIKILEHLPADAPSLGMLFQDESPRAQAARQKLRQFLGRVQVH